MKSGVLSVLLCLLAVTPVGAGHESPFYPSFYPQEITIESVDPAAAGGRLRRNALHAYIGGDPFAGGSLPPNVKPADALGSYLVVTFDPASSAVASRERRCASSERIVRGLAESGGAYVFHPFPVTPYHADYLEQYDLAEAARAAARGPAGPEASRVELKVGARGAVARKLAGARWRLVDRGWDVLVEEVDLDDLLASHRIASNGALGPPWAKQGWFHAYLLLAGAVTGEAEKRTRDDLYGRLVNGASGGVAERFNLERKLVAALRAGCERVVVGYTVRREYWNDDYSAGVENVGRDSQTGLNSAIFVRTVKLKDFPWNGWLSVGVASRPTAAWNPIAGFTDAAGRLVWSALADPAFLP